MRRFVVVGHEARTAPNFSLEDLLGSSGRMDILVRCATAAFLVSYGIRRDTELYLVLKGPPRPTRTIHLVGSELRHLNPDERSTAALFRKALAFESISESVSTPGIYVSGLDFQQVLTSLKGPFILLKEDGTDIRSQELPQNAIYVMSDHKDFDDEEEEILSSHNPQVIRLGPRSLHSEQCITLVHNELDRIESSR